ncbi:MAG: Ig-like domain-containing protein [Oscillospiraceae bacterium]|nr:Ig-like domain-containing protein [Oscillospiraceae bacterium]
MKRKISIILTIIMLLALTPPATQVSASRTPSNWAVPAMADANTSGLLTPSAADDFIRPLTRDEFCELVVELVERTLGEPLPVPPNNPFTDDTDPISIHALKAWNYGIITGVTTTMFAPELSVERQQICAMMIRAIRGLERDLNMKFLKPGLTTLTYADANKIAEYALEPVKLAYTNGIMIGNDINEFLPKDDILSQECVAVIIRSFNSIEAVRIEGMTTSQLLDAAENRVHIGYAFGDTSQGVSQNLSLPLISTGNATVTWTSSDSSIINIAGEIGVVKASSGVKTVTLTATIRLKGSTRYVEFVVTTSPYSGDRLLLENAYNELDILYTVAGDGPDSVTGRIGLPTKVLSLPVSWRSNNPSVVSESGIVSTPPGTETRTATLTATIMQGSQTRSKTFTLTVANPEFSRGVKLHEIYFGMTQAKVSQLLGTVRRTISASNTESWQLYYSSNYTNFIAVGFINNRSAAVYSMASNAANQLKNRDDTIITVLQANTYGGVGAVSYTDPGDSSRQFAIMIYDDTTTIGKSRALLAEGQEQFLYELVNAYRVSNSRTIIEWSNKLGTPARVHSANKGVGVLRDRVISGGFDSARYIGGNYVAGGDDAFEALNQILSDPAGSFAMRSQILNASATVFGAGFYGSNTGSLSTYYTYALGNVTSISDVTARLNNVATSTINVNVGAAAAVTISLTMTPSGFNETFTITSSNTNRMKVSNISTSGAVTTLVVTGASTGDADIIVSCNSSGKEYRIPVSVGTSAYARNLTLTCSPTGTAKTLTTSGNNITGKDEKTSAYTLIIGTGDTLTISASTTSGAAVEWSRVGSGTAASVARGTNNNNGIITASNTPGSVTIRARAQTGSNTYITHDIPVLIVSVPKAVDVSPDPVNVTVNVNASISISGLPSGAAPTYTWSSSSHLSRTPLAAEVINATFTAVSAGRATITCVAKWDSSSYLGMVTRTASLDVQGKQFADGINVSVSSINAIPGEEVSVTATTDPPSIMQSSYSFSWVSSDPSVAVVTSSGSKFENAIITGNEPGTATVTVTLQQGAGSSYSKTISVTIGGYPSITFNNPVSHPIVGVRTQFTTSTTPANPPSAYSIRWTCTQEGGSATIDEQEGWFDPLIAGNVKVSAELLLNGVSIGIDTRTITIVE